MAATAAIWPGVRATTNSPSLFLGDMGGTLATIGEGRFGR